MSADLRQRLLAIFATGSAEELAVVLVLIHMLATHPNKGAGEAITPRPAQELKCKFYLDYLMALNLRN